MALAGVSMTVRKNHLRHSDVRLTLGPYEDEALLPMLDALEKMPRFEPEVSSAAAASDTQKDTQKLGSVSEPC